MKAFLEEYGVIVVAAIVDHDDCCSSISTWKDDQRRYCISSN